MDTNDDLIRLDDFKSIQMVVSLTNLTTGVPFPEKKKTFSDPTLHGTLQGTASPNPLATFIIEFLERGLCLEIPERSCSTGHQLMLIIHVRNSESDLDLEATVKVEKMEKIAEGRNTIQVKLIQVVETEWEQFQSLFAKRQEQISDFFDNIRG